jgi:hypothetical protein
LCLDCWNLILNLDTDIKIKRGSYYLKFYDKYICWPDSKKGKSSIRGLNQSI